MAEYEDHEEVHGEHEEGKGIWVLIALALGLTILIGTVSDLLLGGLPLGFSLPLFNEPATLSSLVYHTVVLAASLYIAYMGVRELVAERRFSVEILMAIAALGAVYLDLLFEAATVLLLYSVSEYFEDYIEERARKTIEKLSEFMPEEARVVVDSTERSVSVSEVRHGSLIQVRPGERVPLDGDVVEGSSSVDQSLVTGESTPVRIGVSSGVYAGSMNMGGVITVRVTNEAGETLVSKIITLVMESRRRKASIERLVDRLVKYYVPTVIAASIFTAVAMPRLIGGLHETWLYRALILLVISCPSAFIVSVPATIFTAITQAARNGVVVKGGVYIEKLAKVSAVLFDKTGTLTMGRLMVHEVKGSGSDEDRVLLYAAALDRYSNHPVAQAIVRRAEEKGLDYSTLRVEGVDEVPGKGIVGVVDGIQVALGNLELMEGMGCDCNRIRDLFVNDRHTTVCVSIGGVGVASLCLLDDARLDAVETVKELKREGFYTAILTGDKGEIAEEIGARLGIDSIYSGLLPEDKLRIVAKEQGKRGVVAMVGDGVNDAPALAASDVGIAMGGGGVDVALESADVVLVKDELVRVPYLLKLSQAAMRIAKQNIAASIGIKFILGALGFMGVVPLWFAVASGDDGLTLLLLLNTLRLTRIKS